MPIRGAVIVRGPRETDAHPVQGHVQPNAGCVNDNNAVVAATIDTRRTKMAFADRRDVLKMIGAAAALGVASPARAEHALDDFAGHRRRTFVLIHGAWQNGRAWDGVAHALRQAGHDVEAPTLPGARPGDNQFGIQFIDYVDAVVDVLQRQHHKAIVVAHSSAGMLLQAAAPRAAHKLAMIIFVNAFIVANGQTQLDNIPVDAAAGLTALAQQNAGIVPFAPLEGFVRGALMEGDPAKKQDALLQLLVDQPFSLFSTPVDTAAFETLDIPKALVFCRRDHSADYLGMATRLGHYEVVVADGSHEMLFSAPRAFTNAVLALDASGQWAR
jgi:pimeloyl-ACP methyl ester carboxylesterase